MFLVGIKRRHREEKIFFWKLFRNHREHEKLYAHNFIEEKNRMCVCAFVRCSMINSNIYVRISFHCSPSNPPRKCVVRSKDKCCVEAKRKFSLKEFSQPIQACGCLGEIAFYYLRNSAPVIFACKN